MFSSSSCLVCLFLPSLLGHCHVRLFATLWTSALQAPLFMEFSGQEHWRGLPFHPPGHLPSPGIEPRSSTWQADSLLTELPGKPFAFLDYSIFLEMARGLWSRLPTVPVCKLTLQHIRLFKEWANCADLANENLTSGAMVIGSETYTEPKRIKRDVCGNSGKVSRCSLEVLLS